MVIQVYLVGVLLVLPGRHLLAFRESRLIRAGNLKVEVDGLVVLVLVYLVAQLLSHPLDLHLLGLRNVLLVLLELQLMQFQKVADRLLLVVFQLVLEAGVRLHFVWASVAGRLLLLNVGLVLHET